MTTKFSATVEFLSSSRSIVTLLDSSGEWAGAYRVDLSPTARTNIYEASYSRASQAALCKGGTLDRFSAESA